MGNQIILPHSEAVGGPQTLNIHCDAGEVSDGYHTFNELYEHRYLLFCGLSKSLCEYSADTCWKSHKHWIDDKLEDVWEGWFVAGIELNSGSPFITEWKRITYHLPLEYWHMFYGDEVETPPLHDGHTSQDVIERLKEWLKAGRG